MKRALILNISHNELGLIASLKNLGYYVIGTGNNPSLIGRKYVDEYIHADYSDKELILQVAKVNKIDAICACCNDFGVITAAYVAEKMGLKGHDTYQNALTIHHKDLFKKFALKNGIQTPASFPFENENIALNWVKTCTSYPLMIKPTDLTGGKGCSRADNIKEALCAVKAAFAVSKQKHIVIEPFIIGTQHALCTFLIKEKVHAICSNNEYSITNPYKVEIDTFPASSSQQIQSFLITQIEKIASILHLTDGIFHVQYIMCEGKPYIIEAMRRVLGNLYMLPAEKLTELDWNYWEARAHCGLSIKEFPRLVNQNGFWAYRCVMGTRNGVVNDIIIPDHIQKHMFDKFELWSKGEKIYDYKNSQLGFYFFEFKDTKEMEEIMVNQYKSIRVEYEQE